MKIPVKWWNQQVITYKWSNPLNQIIVIYKFNNLKWMNLTSRWSNLVNLTIMNYKFNLRCMNLAIQSKV